MAGSVAIAIDGIGGVDDPVSPALPRVLQTLARRGLRATFFVEPELTESEPFALTMIGNGGQKIGEGAAPAGDARASASSAPSAWHEAMQLAVGRVVAGGQRAVIVFELQELERGDAMSLFGETLDLIAGLRRAGSVSVVD